VPAVFIDESTVRGYTLAVTLVADDDVVRLRAAVKALVLPGQRRIHFTKESDRRRRAILSELRRLGVSVHIYRCATKDQVTGRRACLEAVVKFAVEQGVGLMVLEQITTQEREDRRLIGERLKRLAAVNPPLFRHESAASEPLLWVSDAVAWSTCKNGEWKARVAPLVSSLNSVDLPRRK
jgi:hypothetical protein